MAAFLDLPTARRQLIEAGRYMKENQLAWGNAGNLSARIGPDTCLITASGTHLGSLGEDDFVKCSLDSTAQASYTSKPSKELPMHRAIYLLRPEIHAVLHASPFFSTLAACSALPIPSNLFVETMYYLERVARIPYHHPGSQALADAVRLQAAQANVLLLENHGVLVYDTSVREALVGLHTLEFACRMAVTARQSGVELNTLSAPVVQDFLNRSGYRPRREWPEEA